MLVPVFVDSSSIIALLHSTDPFHAQAKSWLREVQRTRRGRVTTTAILTEVADGFVRHNRWDLISAWLLGVGLDLQMEIVTVDAGLINRATLFRNQRLDKSWSLTDCISFIVMGDRSMTDALSSDRDFGQVGLRALLRIPAPKG